MPKRGRVFDIDIESPLTDIQNDGDDVVLQYKTLTFQSNT